MKYGTIDIMVNQIRNMQPVSTEKQKVSDDEIDHFYRCKKPNCDKCKVIMSKVN